MFNRFLNVKPNVLNNFFNMALLVPLIFTIKRKFSHLTLPYARIQNGWSHNSISRLRWKKTRMKNFRLFQVVRKTNGSLAMRERERVARFARLPLFSFPTNSTGSYNGTVTVCLLLQTFSSTKPLFALSSRKGRLKKETEQKSIQMVTVPLKNPVHFPVWQTILRHSQGKTQSNLDLSGLWRNGLTSLLFYVTFFWLFRFGCKCHIRKIRIMHVSWLNPITGRGKHKLRMHFTAKKNLLAKLKFFQQWARECSETLQCNLI